MRTDEISGYTNKQVENRGRAEPEYSHFDLTKRLTDFSFIEPFRDNFKTALGL